jgi:hypothetical protein
MFIHIKKHLYLQPFRYHLQAFANGSTEWLKLPCFRIKTWKEFLCKN